MTTPPPSAAAPANPSPPKVPALAVASFVLGISSVMGGAILVVPTVLAIVFGHVAIRRIQRDPQFTGMQMALIGTLLGYGSILIGVVLATVVVPEVRRAREESHRQLMLEEAQLISDAARQYMMENGVRQVTFDIDLDTGAITGPLASYLPSIAPGTRAIDGSVELNGSFSLQNRRVSKGAEIVFGWEGKPR